MINFKKMDYLHLDNLLKDDEIKMRDEIRAFVDRDVIPAVEKHFLKGTFPMELIKELGQRKLIGGSMTGYDCAGYGAVKTGLIYQEIERGDGGLRSFLTTQGELAMFAIWKYGSEDQKKKYLPLMARGELIGCFGLTEEDASANPAQMRTFAYKKNGDWIITGEKMWITNASIADFSIVWAKTDNGVKGFIVEMDKQGVEIIKMKSNISLRAFITAGIRFNNVVVSEKDVLPEAHSLKAPLTCLTEKRYGMSWGAIGAAIECFTQSLEYAKERVMFGRPVVSSQLIQRKLVNMLLEITKAKSISIQLGRIKEKGDCFRHEMVALAALNNLTKSVEIARDAKEIQEINGISLESRVIRHLLNLESLNAYEGVNDIYLLIIGRDITGMQAFF